MGVASVKDLTEGCGSPSVWHTSRRRQRPKLVGHGSSRSRPPRSPAGLRHHAERKAAPASVSATVSELSHVQRTLVMENVNQQGTTRRSMLRAGAMAGTAVALGATGLFAAGTARAASGTPAAR